MPSIQLPAADSVLHSSPTQLAPQFDCHAKFLEKAQFMRHDDWCTIGFWYESDLERFAPFQDLKHDLFAYSHGSVGKSTQSNPNAITNEISANRRCMRSIC